MESFTTGDYFQQYASNQSKVTFVNQLTKKMAQAFVKFDKLGGKEPESVANNANYVQSKFIKVQVELAQQLVFPSLHLLRQTAGEKIKTFILLQSATIETEFLLIMETHSKYLKKSLDAVAKQLIQSFSQDDSELIIQPTTRDRVMRGLTYPQLVEQYTTNNQRFQHLVLSPDMVSGSGQAFDGQFIQFKEKTETLADKFFKIYCASGQAHELSVLNNIRHYPDRLKALRQMDYKTIKQKMLKEAFFQALNESCQMNRDRPDMDVNSYFQIMSNEQTIAFYINSRMDQFVQEFHIALFAPHMSNDQSETDSAAHPSPLVSVYKNTSTLMKYNVLELAYYDYSFVMSIHLISRWFAKYILTEKGDSNNSALLLYGLSAGGKSEIINSLSTYLNAYIWLHKNSSFQNPSLLLSSVGVLHEFDLNSLFTNEYKMVLDYNASTKVDFKNLKAVNATLNFPFLIATNQQPTDIYMNALTAHRQSQRGAIEPESIVAGFRRVFMVPFVTSFNSQYKEPQGDEYYSELYRQFKDVSNLRPSLFNLVFALALYQDNVKIELPPVWHAYCNYVVQSFGATTYGRYYLLNKESIDKKVTNLQNMSCNIKLLSQGDITQDIQSEKAEYMVEFTTQFILTQAQSCANKQELINILKRNDVPHYLRVMKVCNDHLMRSLKPANYFDQLNIGIREQLIDYNQLDCLDMSYFGELECSEEFFSQIERAPIEESLLEMFEIRKHMEEGVFKYSKKNDKYYERAATEKKCKPENEEEKDNQGDFADKFVTKRRINFEDLNVSPVKRQKKE